MKISFVFVVLPSLTLALPSGLFTRQTKALEDETDRLLFSSSMDDFLTARKNKSPAGLDWTSDDCSYSPEKPFGYNFEYTCQRHDFGYRNYKIQKRFDDGTKSKIDNNFAKDLKEVCAKEDGASEDLCTDLAALYYLAVSLLG